MSVENKPATGESAGDRDDALYTLLVESVRDYAIFALDPSGRVRTWNAGAQRLKGYTASEILGESFTKFYPPDAIATGFPAHELEVASREGRFEDEGWRIRKDGSRFWANVVITALRDGTGQLVGFAKVTRDLTARREAEEQARRLAAEEAAHAEALRRSDELARLNEQLQEQAVELEAQAEELQSLLEDMESTNEQLHQALTAADSAREAAERSAIAVTEANRELDQFAYVTSHDLKAPLRGIANLAQWIQDDGGDRIPEESAEHLRLLLGRVRRMEALVDGILAYSRAGRVLGTPERVDTGALLRDAIELASPPEGVRVEVAPDMPVVMAERVPLQQVFLNLIGNAAKHGRVGRPSVMVRVGWRDAGDAVEFTVSDDGPGIPPEYHQRIWEIFQTLESRDKVEGAGIGLSVVRKIVESRGGRAWLTSTPPDGATFGFTWPKVPRQDPRS
jgi:PAS domain S-box-containing protein